MNGHLRPIVLATYSCVHALIHELKLIISYEPTSNLDSSTGRRMIDLLRQVARCSDRVLIVVTHDLRIPEFADRIAPIGEGIIMGVPTPE